MLEGLPPNGAAFLVRLETDEATARLVADTIVETFDPAETAAAAFEKEPSTDSWKSELWVVEVYFGPEPDEEIVRESLTGWLEDLARLVPKPVIRGIQFGLGLQLALLNHCEEMCGAQIGPLYNYAPRMRGFRLRR